MANPVIVFNSSTGSDTAASGAGPATAVTGTSAAHTGGVSSTTITLTNSPDLSGVATDGSHCLWLKTSSGRQYSKITGVDDVAKTVTVGDSFNIASGSAVDYAIGGKRATLDHADSRTLGDDVKDGWVIELETDQTLTGSAYPLLTIASYDSYTIRSSSTSVRRVITQSANAPVFERGTSSGYLYVRFEGLELRNSNASKTDAYGVDAQNAYYYLRFYNCILGHATDQLYVAVNWSGGAVFYDCEILECTDAGIKATAALYGS